MTIGRLGLGAVLAIALLGLSAVPASAAPLRVDVLARPGDSAAPIEVSIPHDATSVSVPIQIALGRKLPARRDPRFGLSPLTVQEPSAGRLPTTPKIVILVGGRDITSGGFHPKTRGTWAAELRISGIDSFGTFEGDILAGIGFAPLSSRAHVVIHRLPAAALDLTGFPGGVRTVTASSARVEVPLEVHGTNIGAAGGVRLDVAPLRTATGLGASVEVAVDAIPSTIVGLEAGRRTLLVTMPEPGTYEGTVTLSWDGSSRDVALRVEWVIPPLGVTVLATQGANGELPMCVMLAERTFGRCATDAVWIAVQETSGRDVTVDAPTLRSLVRREGSRELAAPEVSIAASLECVGIDAGLGVDDAATSTASIAAPASIDGPVQTCGRVSYDAAAQRLTLGPGAIARLRLQFAGDLAAGEYEAQFALAGESPDAAVSATSLFLRVPPLGAGLVFLVGCFAALPIRRLLTTGRRHVRRQARISALGTRLDAALRAAPDAEARGVATQLQATAVRAIDAIQSGRHGGGQTDRAIDDLETRVRGIEHWVGVWADSARLPGAVQDRVRSRLVTIARTLVQDERLTDLDRRTVDDIVRLGEQLATATAGRASAIRDPQHRRSDEPETGTSWRAAWTWIIRRARWGTAIEGLTLIAVTTLAGLAFIWAPNATWGSTADILVALAWSMGVLVVATAALTGLGGIRSQLGRPDTL